MITKNDNFFKLLFAIEMALLPLVICANLIMPVWAIPVIIGILIVVKFWRESFKEKSNRTHAVVNTISTITEFAVLFIFFMCKGLLNIPFSIVVLVLIVLFEVFNQVFFGTQFNDTINAVDYCFKIFEFIALGSLAALLYFEQAIIVSLCAMLLSTVISIGYKLYYGFRYHNWFGRIKAAFRRR